MTNDTKQDEMIAFANLVLRMRTAQKDYFHTRSNAALERSKKLEKEVDKSVQEILYPTAKLF